MQEASPVVSFHHVTVNKVTNPDSSCSIIGLCLLQNELCPMFLNRHVLKYMLGRPVRFHDLAFFDPVVYESLRQLIVDAETGDSHSLFAALDLNFRCVS